MLMQSFEPSDELVNAFIRHRSRFSKKRLDRSATYTPTWRWAKVSFSSVKRSIIDRIRRLLVELAHKADTLNQARLKFVDDQGHFEEDVVDAAREALNLKANKNGNIILKMLAENFRIWLAHHNGKIVIVSKYPTRLLVLCGDKKMEIIIEKQ